jgi:fumarate reductase subunit C
MSPRYSALLWLAQRLSALVLAFCVVVHLATIIVAVQSGITAAEILDRTQSSVLWFLFYSLFVIAVAIHAPIGLRNIAREHFGWGHGIEAATSLFGLLLLAMGFRAVWGVFS